VIDPTSASSRRRTPTYFSAASSTPVTRTLLASTSAALATAVAQASLWPSSNFERDTLKLLFSSVKPLSQKKSSEDTKKFGFAEMSFKMSF
jgi:hypothetical protein